MSVTEIPADIKVIAFDFDGVILESVQIKDETFPAIFENASDEEKRAILAFHLQTPGMKRQEKIAHILTNILNQDISETDFYTRKFAKHIEKRMKTCSFVPGILQFLEKYRELPMYIVSAAPAEEVQKICAARQLTHYFKDTFGAPEKKPEILEKIAQFENINPHNLLFIGDKLSDMHAATSKNIQFIGRVSFYNPSKFPDEISTINSFS